MAPNPRQEPGRDVGRREPKKRRSGSRLLLAAALTVVIFGALFIGAHLADFLCDILGIASSGVRLGMKVACTVAALPAGFYLVERCFLSRARGDAGGDTGPRGRKEP